jgi:hypothetical protein
LYNELSFFGAFLASDANPERIQTKIRAWRGKIARTEKPTTPATETITNAKTTLRRPLDQRLIVQS